MKVISREDVILLHYAYDPVKAHEYYMQNRELKGRKPAVKKTPTRSIGANAAAKSGAQLAQKPIIAKPNSAKIKAQAQVAVIQKRLNTLNNVLKGLEAEKRAADKKASEKKATSSTSKSSESDRKLTVKQKAENNKRAKDYYKDNKQEIAKKNAKEAKPKEKTLDEKIAYVKDQIKKVKVELAVAKVKAGIK